jgi:mannose-6-phosphate isomerase-like protein (cupin superfamily)
MSLTRGAKVKFDPSAKSLMWFLLLDGTARLTAATETLQVTPHHSIFLSPRFDVSISTDDGASLLLAETTDTGPIDPGNPASGPHYMALDWTREEVLQTERDARKRVRVVTGDICGTGAIRIEMAIYLPGSRGTECYHEGAAMFAYVLTGSGSAIAQGQSMPLRPGDVFYCGNRENHYLKANSESELRFVEFYAPGVFKTVWTHPGEASAWVKTGHDIEGRVPEPNVRERWAYRYIFVPRLGAF